MDNKTDSRMDNRWQQRWDGAAADEGLTPIGKAMFKAKREGILAAIQNLDIDDVLEVGCGLGYTLKTYHDFGYDAFGIDASENSIEVCKNKGLSCATRTL